MMRVLLGLLLAAPALAKAPAPVPASALLLRQATPEMAWRWRAAPELATQPGLLKAMRGEAQAELAKAKAAAARDAAEAKKAGFPFRAYETINDWSLAADTPGLLALAGEVYSYTGGAHGNTGFGARLWDKATKRSVPIDALFTDWPRARKLLEPVYCKALAEEQARRRQGAEGPADFAACPKLSEQPVVPFAGLGRQARQFRVLLAPYVAGSYAEGSYLITAPWPEGVAALVKPAYRRDLFGDDG
jgi:Deacetylase PdaC